MSCDCCILLFCVHHVKNCRLWLHGCCWTFRSNALGNNNNEKKCRKKIRHSRQVIDAHSCLSLYNDRTFYAYISITVQRCCCHFCIANSQINEQNVLALTRLNESRSKINISTRFVICCLFILELELDVGAGRRYADRRWEKRNLPCE